MKRFLTSLFIAVSVLLPSAMPLAAAAGAPAPHPLIVASAKSEACDGVGLTGGSCSGGGAGINNVVKTLINLLSAIVGVVAVVMIIIGGMKYITSAGDANKVAGAKSTIIYAIVGLVIVALAQLIVHFVIQSAS